MHVVVLGAGLAGLATAYELAQGRASRSRSSRRRTSAAAWRVAGRSGPYWLDHGPHRFHSRDKGPDRAPLRGARQRGRHPRAHVAHLHAGEVLPLPAEGCRTSCPEHAQGQARPGDVGLLLDPLASSSSRRSPTTTSRTGCSSASAGRCTRCSSARTPPRRGRCRARRSAPTGPASASARRTSGTRSRRRSTRRRTARCAASSASSGTRRTAASARSAASTPRRSEADGRARSGYETPGHADRDRGRPRASASSGEHERRGGRVECDEIVNTIPLPRILEAFSTRRSGDEVHERDREPASTRAIVFVYLEVDKSVRLAGPLGLPARGHLTIHRISEFKNFSDDAAPGDSTVVCCEITCREGDEIWNLDLEEGSEIAIRDLETSG